MDEEQSDELATQLQAAKPNTLAPSYNMHPLPNHRNNSHPSSQPLSQFAPLITDGTDERIDKIDNRIV